MWREEAVHAADWSYAMVTSACPGKDDGVAVFNADAWSPNTDGIQFDLGFARQWLDQVLDDGLSKDALYVSCIGRDVANSLSVIPAHGSPTPLKVLLDITGYMYPEMTAKDWRNGTICCESS